MTQALRLVTAIGNYDHVQDLMSGIVRAEGIEILPLQMQTEEMFFRFLKYEEFDVAEFSLGMYTSLTSQNDPRFIAIPVFPSKMFRHSAFYVRAGSPITTIEQLRGARVGIAHWSQTAATYVRGMLAEHAGLPLDEIEWVNAGVNEPGRTEGAVLNLPPAIRLTARPENSLDELLVDGEIDAVISARAPKSSFGSTPRIVRMFADYTTPEKEYFAATGVFPIMHVIVIRRPVYEANRWIARSLYKAFEEARQRSLERLHDETATHVAVPWLLPHLAQSDAILGPDPFAYGVEPNRTTLEAFVRFAFDQGLAHRRMRIEELFAPELRTEYRV